MQPKRAGNSSIVAAQHFDEKVGPEGMVQRRAQSYPGPPAMEILARSSGQDSSDASPPYVPVRYPLASPT